MTVKTIKIKDLFIRSVGEHTYPYLNRKRKDKKESCGKIIHIPKKYIGNKCIVVPLSSSQLVYFRNNTLGYKRAKKYIEGIIKNPRNYLDKL